MLFTGGYTDGFVTSNWGGHLSPITWVS